jgi:hypothetical protein
MVKKRAIITDSSDEEECKSFNCVLCDAKFSTRYLLNKHREHIHPIVEKKIELKYKNGILLIIR